MNNKLNKILRICCLLAGKANIFQTVHTKKKQGSDINHANYKKKTS